MVIEFFQTKRLDKAQIDSLLVGLSKLQLERYHLLHHKYQEEAYYIVLKCKTRGPNSFLSVIDSSNLINNATGEDKTYLTALADEFETFVPKTEHEVINIVSTQREAHGQPPFTVNIGRQSLEEVAKVCFYETGTFNTDTKIIVGIQPLVKLLVG